MIHVLILEDEHASMEALVRILNEYSAEIQVHAASSYKEAKDLLEARRRVAETDDRNAENRRTISIVQAKKYKWSVNLTKE